VAHYVITERYTHQWKALPFPTISGMAIPIFDDEKRAQGFIDANWESLGPGWKPQLAYVLERYAREEGAQVVVLDPPPAPVAHSVEVYKVEVVEIEQFITLLREHYRL
jgi:hypothetical protein